MRTLLLIATLGFPVAPALAEGDVERGADLVEEGLKLLFNSIFAELSPQLEELRDRMGDMSAYEFPEVLPNGDILIRRKPPLAKDGEIDL
jgi:hypothetical protein